MRTPPRTQILTISGNAVRFLKTLKDDVLYVMSVARCVCGLVRSLAMRLRHRDNFDLAPRCMLLSQRRACVFIVYRKDKLRIAMACIPPSERQSCLQCFSNFHGILVW